MVRRLFLEPVVERLGDVDHLLELAHRFPQLLALDVDCGVVHQQLVLAAGKTGEDRLDVALGGGVAVEVALERVAEDRDHPEQLATAELALAAGIDRKSVV